MQPHRTLQPVNTATTVDEKLREAAQALNRNRRAVNILDGRFKDTLLGFYADDKIATRTLLRRPYVADAKTPTGFYVDEEGFVRSSSGQDIDPYYVRHVCISRQCVVRSHGFRQDMAADSEAIRLAGPSDQPAQVDTSLSVLPTT